MPLGEVFLGAFLTVLLEKLASGELLKLIRVEGFNAQLEKWSKKLMIIQAVLDDAESKDTNDAVKMWLYDIQVLALDLDDVVDELTTKALQRKLREAEASTSKVSKFLTTITRPLGALKFNHKMASKIKEISSRLEELVEQIKIHKLVRNVLQNERTRPEITTTDTRLPTTSLVCPSQVYGRGNDKESIVEMLLQCTPTDDSPSLIPIVGMGGIGKTTLAQLVYNDPRVKEEFPLTAWICVSDNFDVIKLTRSILEQVFPECHKTQDFNLLQVELKEKLSKEKILLVLDDVWNEDASRWDALRKPFLHGFPGSKIIVTTRNDSVAKMMSSVISYCPYQLSKLNNEDGLSLLARHAIGLSNFDSHPHLKAVGKGIVSKCEHLPLAIKALGGSLRGQLRSEDWEYVLNSDIWDTDEGKGNVLPALKLSYNHLPSRLKQCLAFCSIFPKDYEFDKHDLVLLWMAEGYVPQQQGKKPMQAVGEDYFEELLGRLFFEQSTSNSDQFVMHDLIVDLARYVAGNMCVRLEDEWQNNRQIVRHSSFVRSRYEVFSRFQAFHKALRMRTFLPLPICKEDDRYSQFFLSNGVLVHLLPKLGCLRVLSLSGYAISELPNSIGKLKHLRYLNLSGTKLTCLPETVSALCNLQTLLLRQCKNLTKLPAGMQNLVHLLHLDNSGTNALCEMPVEISELKSLQSLPNIVLSSGGFTLKHIGNLSHLKGSISIRGLQNEVCCDGAVAAKLKDKQFIDELRLSWSDSAECSQNENLQFRILEGLEPNQNLKVLEISSYRGASFPCWIGDQSFSALVNVKLYDCCNCTTLPSLGRLPLLKGLFIGGMNKLQTVGTEFYGDDHPSIPYFPSLEVLAFSDMEEWEDWSSPGLETASQFPRIQKFCMSGCRKLIKIPLLLLDSLRELELRDCKEEIMKNFIGLASLVKLKLRNILGLTCLDEAFLQFPSAIEANSKCDELVCLWEMGDAVPSFTSLQEVKIEECPKLVSVQVISSFPTLQALHIHNCIALEFLPDNIAGLRSLVVENCPSLKVMATTTPLETLKKLYIWECVQLELVSLLQECSTSLDRLWIQNCPNLDTSKLMRTLVMLNLVNCDGVESFPEGGLPNLKLLQIGSCKDLKFLPSMTGLVSLTHLLLFECGSLENFPQGEFPSKLTSLVVSDCMMLKPLIEWGLHGLTSFKTFFIYGGYPELVCFQDDDGFLFPPRLNSLSIVGLPNLERLHKSFQDLTSLQSLFIGACPKLRSLAPTENLLEKLHLLVIAGCPMVEKKCKKNKGEYWPLISNIPCLYFGDHVDGDVMENQILNDTGFMELVSQFNAA